MKSQLNLGNPLVWTLFFLTSTSIGTQTNIPQMHQTENRLLFVQPALNSGVCLSVYHDRSAVRQAPAILGTRPACSSSRQKQNAVRNFFSVCSWRASAISEQDTDPYTVLGLSSTATIQQIKHAFRSLSRRCHPDTASVPTPAQEFCRISAAYHALIDPARRAAYDATGRSPVWELLATRKTESPSRPLRRQPTNTKPSAEQAAAAAAATAAEIFGERRWQRGGGGGGWASHRRATWTPAASPGGNRAGPFSWPGACIGRAKGATVRMAEGSFASGGERGDWGWLWEAAAQCGGARRPAGGSAVDADACTGYLALREALPRGRSGRGNSALRRLE